MRQFVARAEGEGFLHAGCSHVRGPLRKPSSAEASVLTDWAMANLAAASQLVASARSYRQAHRGLGTRPTGAKERSSSQAAGTPQYPGRLPFGVYDAAAKVLQEHATLADVCSEAWTPNHWGLGLRGLADRPQEPSKKNAVAPLPPFPAHFSVASCK